jgi:hypothetical protein
MSISAYGATNWLEVNHEGMIRCPFQPGQLVISRAACLKRHIAAAATDYEDIMKVDPFRHKLKKGLLLCAGCAIGKRLAAAALGQGAEADPSGLQALSA